MSIPAPRRRALPGGPDGIGVSSGTPSWGDPSEVDERVIYRRPDAVPLRFLPLVSMTARIQ